MQRFRVGLVFKAHRLCGVRTWAPRGVSAAPPGLMCAMVVNSVLEGSSAHARITFPARCTCRWNATLQQHRGCNFTVTCVWAHNIPIQQHTHTHRTPFTFGGELGLVEVVGARPHHVPGQEHLPRQSVGGGKFIQNRNGLRFSPLKTTAFEEKLTFGDPFLDSGVVPWL